MKIRAITLGCEIRYIEEKYDELEENLSKIQELKTKFSGIGMDIETVRLCTPPFHKDTHLNQSPFFTNPDIVLEALDDFCEEHLIDFYSAHAGLCDQTESLTQTQKKLIKKLPKLLRDHKNMFTSLQLSSKNGMNFEAIRFAGEITKKLSEIDPFLNLKYASTFNVPPNTPFFPSAYHIGHQPKISVALEAADEITSLTAGYCNSECNLSVVRSEIQERFTSIYDQISGILKPFCDENKLKFEGVDFSPSQYPTPEKSIARAIESFQIAEFGDIGTVFGIGFLTSVLKSIDRPKIGFSGFMQPLLEDYYIAERHEQGKIDIKQLLLNSCVCGLGLDTIPLPGDINIETLYLLMLDVAMISSRLDKPLTTRLMPIPNKNPGEKTEFDFEYFKNSSICAIDINKSFSMDEFIDKNRSIKL